MGNRHETPDDLDVYFDRDLIDPSQYKYFWSNYWHFNEYGTLDFEIDDLLSNVVDPEILDLLAQFEESATLEKSRK